MLVAPPQADLGAEGDDPRDVIDAHGRALKRWDERLDPVRSVASHCVGYVDATQLAVLRILGVGGPELAGRVLGDRDGLHTALGYGYREALIERVAVGRGIVAVA